MKTVQILFSGPYFPAFGLNTERYGESLRIQSECGKIRTRRNSVFGHVSRSVSTAFANFIDLYFKIQKWLNDNFSESIEEDFGNMFIWDHLSCSSAVDMKDY